MSIQDKLHFYVLNYDFNNHKVIHYNIFNNIRVHEYTLKLIKDLFLKKKSK